MAFPETHCDTCDLAGTGARCHSQRVKVAALCGPEFREFVRKRTAEDHANGLMDGPPSRAVSYGPARIAEAAHRPDSAPAWRPHIGPLDSRKELVVARYREDISWLAAVPFAVRVYNHGDPIGPPAGHVEITPIPPTGREAHCYLWHITAHYDDLAELTFFTQADPWDHAPDYLARIRAWWDEPTSLAPRYLPDLPPDWIKARDRVSRINGFEIRYGDAAIEGHGDSGKILSGKGWFNPSAWDAVFGVSRPSPQWFGYGATWATPWWAVRRRPLSFWRWLLREVERAGGATGPWNDPPLTAWAIEAMWYYLFSDPAEFPHRPECAA